MFVPAFVEQVDLVRSCDGNGGVDWHVGDCYPDDPLVVALEVFDLSF